MVNDQPNINLALCVCARVHSRLLYVMDNRGSPFTPVVSPAISLP